MAIMIRLMAVLALLAAACGAGEPTAREPQGPIATSRTQPAPASTDPTAPAEPAVTVTTTGFVAPPPPAGWTVWLDEELGFSVAYPPTWFQAESTLTSGHDPVELVSLATFPLSPERDTCGPFPMQAVADFPADGAFVSVRERVLLFDPDDFMARPTRVGPETLSTAMLERMLEGDCLTHTDRGDAGSWHWIWFDDQDRALEVFVVVGNAVSDERAEETWAIVNSLAFAPRQPVESPASLNLIYAGNVFVLDPGDGPMVCGIVLASFPPQCGGPFLDGLDWEVVPWAETAGSKVWADMYIEVRVVGGRLQLVAPPTEVGPVDPQPFDTTPPCPVPEGGWVFTHGPGATEDDLDEAVAYSRTQPDFSGLWVHHLTPPVEFTPAELVLVALFTGDLERHEAAIRDLWSGPLCVAHRSIRMEDLETLQDDLVSLSALDWPPSIFYPHTFGVDTLAGVVELTALIVTPEGQQWLDDRYGPGLVSTVSRLEPITATNSTG